MIELVDPRGAWEERPAQLSARVETPGGLRKIGFLSNEPENPTGPHFPGYTRVLSGVLRDRVGVEAFHLEIKPVLSRPAETAMLERFRGCDAVINGLAK